MYAKIASYYQIESAACDQIEERVNRMSVEEKIGQLFFILPLDISEEALKGILSKYPVGGMMLRPMEKSVFAKLQRFLGKESRIPLLLSANLEAGSTGVFTDGTPFQTPMGVAATGDTEQAFRLGRICCNEPGALGINMSFSPVVDRNSNFRNPITNTRTFGSSVEAIIQYGQEYMRAAKEENIAVTLKHFPGDGEDERDQHLLVSVNDLSYEEWFSTHGKIYSELLKDRPEAIMLGHIALPDVVAAIAPESSVEERYAPSSLSKIVIQSLLRERLDFQGLAVTDSTLMAGFSAYLPRKEAVPLAIANG